MPIASRGLSLILFAFTGAALATSDPRTNVEGVARTIEQNYFDAERARAIGAQLRAEAARGAFDRLTDARDLATTLTERLKPIDRHFAVSWSPQDAPAQGAQARPAPPPADLPDDRVRRDNYGIRRVEVLPGNVGYVDLRLFADFDFGKPDQPARQAIEAALALTANADALIIDLRGNGGGSPAMVGYLVSAFTPKGADIYNTFHSREGTASEAPAQAYAKPRLDTPLYVLTSARTGSAAEAFAYTLKNARRATIVGEASGGAANPGATFDAGNGLRVFVSTGSPVSPITRTNWEGSGVQPDVAVDAAAALERARMLALQSIVERGPEADRVAARWALEALQAKPQAVAFADYVGGYGALSIARDGERLSLHRGRRPPLALLPLGGDAFAAVDDPTLRVVFERDAGGKVVAFDTRTPDGPGSRHRRSE